jgi:hypothetical protein
MPIPPSLQQPSTSEIALHTSCTIGNLIPISNFSTFIYHAKIMGANYRDAAQHLNKGLNKEIGSIKF